MEPFWPTLRGVTQPFPPFPLQLLSSFTITLALNGHSLAMVLPSTISEVSPLDPLLLLPLPHPLPPSPLPDLEPLLATLNANLSSSDPTIPMAVLTTHMRKINRHAQILLNAARVAAAGAREGLDRVDVELRGVEYERNRVQEEMERCREYA